MNYDEAIRSAQADPQRLEELFRSASGEGAAAEFARAIERHRQEIPDSPLLAAWHYRLQPTERPLAAERGVPWRIALPIAVITSVVFAVLSLPALDYPDRMPYIVLVWSLLGGAAIVAYLALAGADRWTLWSALATLLVAGAYVTLVTLLTEGGRWVQYRTLMAIHLPVLAVAAVAIKVLRGRRNLTDRFAFLLKAIEVCVVGGVFVIVGGIFAAITFGLFQAIGVELSLDLQRGLVSAGGGAITVLAVAVVHDPRLSPAAQRVEQGLGRIVPPMFRLLLPLALCVLVVYLCVIPFNFMVPFESRDVLIVYNIMLFAVVGLLLGATPLRSGDMQTRHDELLRVGYVVVAALAVVISIYALSATAYRTALGGLTLNRLTVIGWNTTNIGLLVLVIVRALSGRRDWVPAVQSAFIQGAVVYVAWTAFLVLGTPWLFP